MIKKDGGGDQLLNTRRRTAPRILGIPTHGYAYRPLYWGESQRTRLRSERSIFDLEKFWVQAKFWL